MNVTNKHITILGIAGSLRKDSYNKAILQEAQKLARDYTAEIEIFEKLGEIPLFNQDDEKNPPKAVEELKEKAHMQTQFFLQHLSIIIQSQESSKMPLIGHQDHMTIVPGMQNLLLS